MQVSLNWLKEYIDVELSPQELGDKLSMAGLVVESLEEQGDDWIFEFESLANRPDWLSVHGIVREIAMVTQNERKGADIVLKESGEAVEKSLKVTIEDKEACPRYAARVLRNIKVADSPEWMQDRLRKSGIRPINNIVDVTNYVLLEYGQPLHAFDYDTLQGKEIHVRRAHATHFTTLDGEERVLKEEMLVITDAQEAVAVAGVMGGANSEVGTNTETIVLESAYFDPAVVRLSSKLLNVSTEASYRFERGADVDCVLVALDRAASLLQEIAAARVMPGTIDLYEKPLDDIVIEARVEKINRIVGLELSAEEMSRYLTLLDFDVTQKSDDLLTIEIPNFRREVLREEDIAEEIARAFGYDYIPSTTPHLAMQHMAMDPMERLIRHSRKNLIKMGLNEAINYSFVSPKDQKEFKEGSIRLALPLSEEQSVMRRSLVPGLLKNESYNVAYNGRMGAFFELGQSYCIEQGESVEADVLAFVTPQGLRYAKGYVHALCESWGLADRLTFKADDTVWCESGRAMDVLIDGDVVGYVGIVSGAKLAQFGIKDTKTELGVAEIELGLILPKFDVTRRFEPLAKFPSAQRDMVLKMPEEMLHQTVLDAIRSLEIDILKDLKLFDIYQGDQLGKGLKSMGFALTFQSHERTLTDEEMEAAYDSILKHVDQNLGLTLRDK